MLCLALLLGFLAVVGAMAFQEDVAAVAIGQGEEKRIRLALLLATAMAAASFAIWFAGESVRALFGLRVAPLPATARWRRAARLAIALAAFAWLCGVMGHPPSSAIWIPEMHDPLLGLALLAALLLATDAPDRLARSVARLRAWHGIAFAARLTDGDARAGARPAQTLTRFRGRVRAAGDTLPGPQGERCVYLRGANGGAAAAPFLVERGRESVLVDLDLSRLSVESRLIAARVSAILVADEVEVVGRASTPSGGAALADGPYRTATVRIDAGPDRLHVFQARGLSRLRLVGAAAAEAALAVILWLAPIGFILGADWRGNSGYPKVERADRAAPCRAPLCRLGPDATPWRFWRGMLLPPPSRPPVIPIPRVLNSGGGPLAGSCSSRSRSRSRSL
ncbi:MAG: hypothetical protein EXR72_26840 [Myxococcales bacterium]|nr:hypothetical protein [Myxococcales bacterium]